jgi:Domain of unknown function (DUF4382)/Domain of unknown function (DUF5666)
VGKKIPVLSALLLLLVFLGACGGSSHSSSDNEVPVVVSISDQPSSVGVLSFDIQITGACLVTSANAFATDCSGAQNLLPDAPMNVQIANMQTPQQSDVLATTNVQPGKYTGILVTFGTATAAVNVDPNSTDADTATPPNSCTAAATPKICELSPTFKSSFVNLPFPKAATLSAGQPTSISIEFSVADSLVGTTAGSTTTFTITPILAAGVDTIQGSGGSLVDISNVTGPVTSVITSSFTVTDAATGQPVTVDTFSGTTMFNGFSNCNTNDLACVQVGQIVTVDYAVSDSSPLVLSASSVSNNNGFQNGQVFEGTVVATTPTPMVLVTAVLAGNTQDVNAGQVLTLVPPSTSAGFSVAVPAGQTLPASVSFAGDGDLVVGQNVLIDSTGVDDGVVTSDEIELEPTQFDGTVSSITSPNLTVNGLNNFFSDNGIATIQVQTGTQTTFGGSAAANGFKGLTVGVEANFAGFLFNGGVGQSPIVFGENIFDNTLNSGAGKKDN